MLKVALDPEDLNKDVLQCFPLIFDVKILLKNWHADQATTKVCELDLGLKGVRWLK